MNFRQLVIDLHGSLRDAGCKPSDVGHIHAHGLSTRSCDEDEARAIRRVFENGSGKVPVVAAKSYFGNLGAGSGMWHQIPAGDETLRVHRRFFKDLEAADSVAAVA